MKNFRFKIFDFRFLLVVLIGIAFSSCSFMGGGETPEFRLSDLQALWLQDNDTTEHYVRFTTEQTDSVGFFYGREWHEYHGGKLAVYEQDLLDAREDLGHPGNGWFMYKFVTKGGGLFEIHLMDNEGAELPKYDYVVSKLTDTTLEYYEKSKKSNKFSFSKVVEEK